MRRFKSLMVLNPYVADNDNSTLMCMFHVLKAVHAFKFRNPGSREKIKIDIKVLKMCGNPIVFSHALQLFMSEWKIEEPQFCEYFEREWVQKHPNWYAAANLRAIHTLRQRLVLTMFKETLCKMLRYKSAMYIREKEAKVFYSEPKISRDDWSKAAEYAMDPDTQRRIFLHNHLYYILSGAEIKRENQRITNGEAAAALFYSTEAESYQEYLQDYHQCVYELNLNDNWMDSTCSCPYFMKHLICKHVLTVAMLRHKVRCPTEANPTILSRKPKRGRKSQSKGALYKPKN